MRDRFLRLAVFAGSISLAAAAGCSLLVDFDESKIPPDDAGEDGFVQDSAIDTAKVDSHVDSVATDGDATDAADTTDTNPPPDTADAADTKDTTTPPDTTDAADTTDTTPPPDTTDAADTTDTTPPPDTTDAADTTDTTPVDTADAGLAAGAACTSDVACASGACDIAGSGHCCAAACTKGGVCGATSCAPGTGACVYPTSSCPSCTGSTLTPGTCGGGTCTTGTAGPCGGSLTCASATACNTTCGSSDATGDGKCATGNFCLSVDGGFACTATLAPGAACNRGGQCTSGSCNTTADASGGFCI